MFHSDHPEVQYKIQPTLSRKDQGGISSKINQEVKIVCYIYLRSLILQCELTNRQNPVSLSIIKILIISLSLLKQDISILAYEGTALV